MKSLTTLIKLQKMRVDEQRLQLARLQDHLDKIDQAIAELELRRAREMEAARDSAAGATLGVFLKGLVAQQRGLEQQQQTAAQAVKIAQDKLSELFEEQKRYEVAEEHRIDQQERAEQKRENLELDEIGAVMHERKQGN